MKKSKKLNLIATLNIPFVIFSLCTSNPALSMVESDIRLNHSISIKELIKAKEQSFASILLKKKHKADKILIKRKRSVKIKNISRFQSIKKLTSAPSTTVEDLINEKVYGLDNKKKSIVVAKQNLKPNQNIKKAKKANLIDLKQLNQATKTQYMSLAQKSLDTYPMTSPLTMQAAPFKPTLSIKNFASKITKKKNQSIKISLKNSKLEIHPKQLELTKGSTLIINEQGFESTTPNIFSRNKGVISIDTSKNIIYAISDGESELFIQHEKQFAIVPVHVGHKKNLTQSNLSFNNELLNHQSSDEKKIQVASSGSSDTLYQPLKVSDALLSQNKADLTSAPRSPFVIEDKGLSYKNVKIRIIDERSYLSDSSPMIYPVGGVSVGIIGTDFKAVSSNNGQIPSIKVPHESRLMVSVEDPHGIYKPTVQEIVVSHTDLDSVDIVLMQRQKHDTLVQYSHLSSNPKTGSICASVLDQDKRPIEGIKVKLEYSDIAPLYFNKYGLPSHSQNSTSSGGRFCFLNIAPGPELFTFFKTKQTPIYSVPVNFFERRHLERSIPLLETSGHILTHLASMPSANQQLVLDQETASLLKPVEWSELVDLGQDEVLETFDYAKLKLPFSTHYYKSRTYLVSDASEFEQALYPYDFILGQSHQHVTPLIPRGFVQDMAYHFDLSVDDNLGSVMVEHGHLSPEQIKSEITIKLVDHFGRSVGSEISYASYPVQKSLFVNVPPGEYVVMIETSDGYWLDVNTTKVYSQTISYLRTGNRILWDE